MYPNSIKVSKMEDKKTLMLLGIGVIVGLILTAISTNTLLLLAGWVLVGYCGSGIYFLYKSWQR